MRSQVRAGVLAAAALLLVVSEAGAQRFTGSAEMGADAYHVSGRPARRPGLSGHVTVSPTLDLWGLQLGLLLTYDSEERYSARSLNRYGLNPRWSWGELYLGDHAPDLGATVLQGVSVRGGGIDVHPGAFRARQHIGRADDAVFTDPLGFGTIDDRQFNTAQQFGLSRMVYALGVGWGRGDNRLSVVALYAADETDVPDTAVVAPQENVTIGLEGGLRLPWGWLASASVSGSLHTLDTRVEAVDYELEQELGLAGKLLDSFVEIRPTTRGDVTYRAEAQGPVPWGTLSLKVEEIGPGYSTLGVPSLPNNWRQIEGTTAFALLDGRLSAVLSGGWRKDGLVDPGTGATHRWTGMVAGNYEASRTLRFNASAMLNRLERRAAVDTFALVNVAESYSFSPSWTPGGPDSPHSLSLNAALQRSETEAGILAPFGSHSFTAGLGYQYRASQALSLGLTPSLVSAEQEGRSENLFTLNGTANYRPRGAPYSLNLSSGVGQSLVGWQVQAVGSARYQIPRVGTASARLRATGFFGDLDYREFALSLGLARSF